MANPLVRTIQHWMNRRIGLSFQVIASINTRNSTGSTTYDVAMVVTNKAKIDRVQVFSGVPVASATNTFDLFRRRATTDVAIITQFDPDTLSAFTISEKPVLAAGADLLPGDIVYAKLVDANAAGLPDISVIIDYTPGRAPHVP